MTSFRSMSRRASPCPVWRPLPSHPRRASAQRPSRRAAGQAEWQQNYDAASRIRVVRSIDADPVAGRRSRHRADDRALSGHRRPRRLARRSAAGQPARRREGPAVLALRQRLIADRRPRPGAGASPVYDSYVEAGVRRFQARHGLNTTGAINAATHRGDERAGRVRLRQLETQRRAPARLLGRSRRTAS